jgi:AcrR family transcriptional regulator
MNKRLDKNLRRQEILEAAVRIAEKCGGFNNLTRLNVANEASCSEALISRYFGTMPQFKHDIMRVAIKDRNLAIIAQGIGMGNHQALTIGKELKREVLDSL